MRSTITIVGRNDVVNVAALLIAFVLVPALSQCASLTLRGTQATPVGQAPGPQSPPQPTAPPVTSQSNTATPSRFLPWVPAVAAIFTALAAFAAMRNARNGARALEASRKAANANLLAGLLKDYSSDEFRTALQCLREFSRRPNLVNGFAAEYAALLKANDPRVQELDKARRRLARYFAAIRTLAEAGLLDPQLVASAFGYGDLRFVVEILVPIDAIHQEVWGDQYDGKTKEFFERLIVTVESGAPAESS